VGSGDDLAGRLITYSLARPDGPGRTGVVYVDNRELLLRAIDRACEARSSPVQELVAPVLVRRSDPVRPSRRRRTS